MYKLFFYFFKILLDIATFFILSQQRQFSGQQGGDAAQSKSRGNIFVDNSNNVATFYPNGRSVDSKSLVSIDYGKVMHDYY